MQYYRIGRFALVVLFSVASLLATGLAAQAATVSYPGSYSAVPQGDSMTVTVTKSGGSPFVGGMTVTFNGSGLVGTLNTVVGNDVCTVDIIADRDADAGTQEIYLHDGMTLVGSGDIDVYHPHQLIAAREAGTVQEPPRSAVMGANGVYLHSGEFRHDLPFLSIPGRMLPLSAGGTYRSQLESLGWLGAGWTASFDQKLFYDTSADDVTLYSGNGRIDLLTRTGGTAGVGPYTKAGFFLTIYRDDNNTRDLHDDIFTIHYAHGSTATFEAVHEDVGGRWTYRITAFSDRFGNTVEFLYHSDFNGYLTEIRGDLYDGGSPTLYRLALAYNSHGRLHTITDYADYTGQQSVIGSSYTGPRVWEFVYNGDAQLIEIKLPKTERYDSETKGSSYRTRVQFTYDGTDNMVEVIDARQANESSPYGWLKNTYDSGKVDYQDVGRTSSADTTHRQYIVYDSVSSNARWVHVINALGHRSSYHIQVNVANNEPPPGCLIKVRHYTAHWNDSLSQTSGKIRNSSYGAFEDPDYFETSYQYDAQFQVIRVDHPRGNRTQFRYDITNGDQRSKGNLLRVLAHPGSASTTGLPANQVHGLLATFTYTSAAQFNLLATSVAPRAYELKSSYDITTHSGGDIEEDNSAHYTTTNTYYFSHGTYPDGTLQKTTSPAVDDTLIPETLNDTQYLESVFTYNSFGQVLTVEDQAGYITEYEYGTSGFTKGYLHKVNAGAQVTPLVTTFGYNSVGRVITVQDPKGETWTSYVNQLDQVVRSETPQVSSQMPMGSAATYFSLAEYDLNGNLEVSKVSNIDEYGNTGSPSTFSTTYVYNILDMVTSVTEPIDGSTNRTFSFEYDLIYRSSESTLPEGNKSATDYDELNRAIMSHAGYGNGVAKGSALITGEVFYDHNSNVIQAVDGRSNESDFTYDAFDRLLKSEDRLTSNRNYTEYTYNRAGQVVDVTRKGNKRVESSGTYSFTADQLLAQSQTVYDNLGRAILSKVKAVSATGGNLGYGGLETANNYSVGWSTSRVKFRNNGQVESVYGDLSDNGSAPESYETKYEYDAYLRLLRVIDDRDGGGASTLDDDNYDQYAYDANGNVASVTAKLYDDAGLGDKTVTTYFFYDEINRLIEDESPSVQTVLPNGTISTGTLTREFKYDSRSNLVRTYDRKGVERVTQYDRINRPIRHKITDVEQRVINPSTGLLSPVVHDIVSRTVYDKNSNAAESIDPNGNRTYFRYDQAGRWLQTQHADGGTPLKTTAGSGHSITQVGSSVFYSKTGAYDGNSNLLKITDENNTETTYTYDNNDLLTGETGSAAGGNPHGIEGETGFEYLYDGMYRSVFGRSYDGTGTLTQIDSLFNSIGGLEQQRQRVLRAHPDDPGFTAEGTVLSKFDESGRRYQRTNPSGLTRVNWKFDRKHRPTETHQEFHNGSSWINGGLAAEYEYLGGGLMHSRQTRYIQQFHPGKSGGPGVATFPFVSTFERDDLLRITRVKHTRDDNDLGISDARLIGRYEYAYDHNSMMTWEARWYHHDADPTANFTPDETDFYSYASDNTLEKGTYSATQYGNDTGIEVANLKDAWAAFADDSDNEGTYSDRVYYGRRKTGTRDNVNWYRGTASGSSSTISQDDTSTGPQQTTSYNTSDDPGADHDNPASDGDGSRHNYTAIGQVDLDYDNNRNVLADGTRQFRYNYRNQLRRVWRKSDGASDGAIAMYREDAYGRRVYAHTHWELGRRVYFDTRFELDVNMDEDGNSHDMQYVDGGITATERSDTHERGLNVASWPSRLDRHYGIEQLTEEHYIDFLIDAPEADDSTLLGIIAYGSSSERYELEIYGEGYYELWFRDGGSNDNQIDGWHGDNASRRNIGLRFSHGNPGVWVNGGQESSTLAPPWPSPTIYFGTLGQDEFHGIVLLENLCYLRSFTRTQLDNSIPGGPRVTATFFDGPQPVTTTEIIEDGSTYQVVVRDNTDPSMSRLPEEGRNELYLVNGRRTTAHVITQGADRYALDGNNTVDMGSGNQAPGTSILLHTDAVGTTTARGRPNPAAIPKPEFIGGTLELTGHYNLDLIGTHFGSSQPPNPPAMSLVESGATYVGEEAQSDVEQGERTPTEGTDNCGCRGDNVSIAMSSVATGDPATGFQHDCLNGNAMDFHPGVQFSGDTIYALQHFKPGKDADGNDVMFFFIGGAKYQLIDATKDDDGLYNVNRDNLKLVEGTDYLKPATAQDWLDSLAEFGGTGGCKDPEADKKALETAEFVFDILGFIPVVGELADVAAGSLAFIQGDIVGAVLSLISTIPVVGDIIAKPIKWAYKAGKKIAWGKFYDLVTKALGDHCADAGLKALIQKKLKELRDFLNEGGLNLPAGWCFTAGTPVATDEGDKPIEELEVGDRVLTPETLNDQWTWTAVDPATWRVIVLELPNPGCEWDIIHLRLLRPLDWLVRHGLPGSMKILLEIDELGVHGLAKVLAIEACPPIRKGRGRVVTGTITHFNGFVKQLSFVGSERPLHPTDVHPFYSRTRKDWIQARHLQPGEEVATTTGSAVVDRVGNLPGIHRVYNLEVEREHCYFVGQELALAHNGCADDILDQFKGFIKKLPANPDDLAKNGWKEVSHPDAVKAGIRKFEDAHGNIIEFHKGTPGANGFKGKDHYHAKNPNATGKQDAYLDKDGNPVADGSKASHLLLD